MHVGNQVPHPYRTQLARRLRLSESQVTVVSPDIGGGFGQKIALYREELTVAALSRALKRPVRWREDRNENLLASCHAREDSVRTRAAVDTRRAHPRPRAEDHRGLRRLLLLSGELRGPRGGADRQRPLPHLQLRLRREGPC